MILGAAALQLSAVAGEVQSNLDRLEEAIEALPPGVTLAVAPELYTTGYDLDLVARRGHELATSVSGPTVERLVSMAKVADLTLVVGFLESEGDQLYDSVVVSAAGGEPVVYRKTHLYPAEMPVFAAGDSLVVFDDTSGTRMGLMICFEHAFPEIATTLALEGGRVLVIPSAVPIGYEHVLALRTRARAQDNQVFAVACNMSAPFCGLSLIVDPRGEILAQAGTGEETIIADLVLEAVSNERAREPSLDLRRPELYR